jgi:regulator of nucleoside diphosphate kinase
MNWLGFLFRRRSFPPPFNPWNIFVFEEPNNEQPPIMTESDANAADLPPKGADDSAAVPEPLPKADEDDSEEWLGIGACMIAPWRAREEGEDQMPNNRKTICVSERDIGLVRKLVSTALNTHSGVTLEYVRLLSSELINATVLPPSRLPPDVVTLHSRVWATDMENGQNMVVTLVMPHQAGDRADRISVLSPLGMALFGYEAGDRIDWGPAARPIRLRVDRVRRTRCQRMDPRPVRPTSYGTRIQTP